MPAELSAFHRESDRRRAIRRARAADEPHLRVFAEEIEQGLEQGGLVRAEQAAHGGGALLRGLARLAVMIGDRVQVVGDAVDRRNLGMVGAGGREPLLGQAVVEEMPLVRQRRIDLAPEEQRPEMRAVHLIEGEIVGIDAEFADVRQAVRREGDAVHEGPGRRRGGRGRRTRAPR